MCTYVTFSEKIEGSAKGPGGKWRTVSGANVYYDHPVHAMAEHTINVDLALVDADPSARVAMELTPASARRLMSAIAAALAVVPEEMSA
jgi:hypothetical protein